MIQFAKDFVQMHFKLGFSRSSANLAYYLLFSFFPFLIFLNSILALINIKFEDIEQYFEFLPEDITILVENYIFYLSSSETFIPLFLGLGLTLYTFSRFVNSLFYIINDVYEIKSPKRSMILSVFFTFSIMLSVYAVVILILAGSFLINLINSIVNLTISVQLIVYFGRLILPTLYFFSVIILLYKFIPKVKLTVKEVFPGAFYTTLGIIVISYGFSIYVNYFSNYSIIYGSLSTIMLLMLWLYLAGMVIIQGSLVNKMIMDRKNTGA